MPDHVKHDIFSVDRETMNDKVLKFHHDSMVDVLESFDVSDAQLALSALQSDSTFVLQDVKSSPHCSIRSLNSPQPNHTLNNTYTWYCFKIQTMRSEQFSSALLVVHNFEWKPGWYCGGTNTQRLEFMMR
ncbi:hypothetical protein HanPSC8_Chr14g0629311 [Helianthus annuus]|nr:hypothetical protein HanPSC8_Chr14g0629311 [Helianthus annuus]